MFYKINNARYEYLTRIATNKEDAEKIAKIFGEGATIEEYELNFTLDDLTNQLKKMVGKEFRGESYLISSDLTSCLQKLDKGFGVMENTLKVKLYNIPLFYIGFRKKQGSYQGSYFGRQYKWTYDKLIIDYLSFHSADESNAIEELIDYDNRVFIDKYEDTQRTRALAIDIAKSFKDKGTFYKVVDYLRGNQYELCKYVEEEK